jgi:hypothetical protein
VLTTPLEMKGPTIDPSFVFSLTFALLLLACVRDARDGNLGALRRAAPTTEVVE